MSAANKFKSFPKTRSTQAAAEAMSGNGIMFFGLVSENSLACWNSNYYEFENDNIIRVAADRETLNFISGLKVI